MKKIIFILSGLFIAVSAMAADNSAATIDAVAAKLRKAPSVTASYILTMPGQGTTSGTLTLASDKFVMKSKPMTIWYDGTTQWTYVASDNEVSIDTPTAREIQQVNPLLILNTFRQGFTSKTVSSSATAMKILLTPKQKKADIRSATVTINPKTKLPQEIALTTSSGQTAIIKISSIAIGKSLPIATFRFNKSACPGAYINDLR